MKDLTSSGLGGLVISHATFTSEDPRINQRMLLKGYPTHVRELWVRLTDGKSAVIQHKEPSTCASLVRSKKNTRLLMRRKSTLDSTRIRVMRGNDPNTGEAYYDFLSKPKKSTTRAGTKKKTMTKSINNNPAKLLINYLTFSSDKPKTTQRIIGSTSDTYTRQLLVEFDDEVHIGIAYFEEHEDHYTRTNRNKQLLIRRFELCKNKYYELLYGNQRPQRPTLSDYKRLVNSHVTMSLLDSLAKPVPQDNFNGDLAVFSYRFTEVDNSAKSLALYRERDMRSFEGLTKSVVHQMDGLTAGYLNK